MMLSFSYNCLNPIKQRAYADIVYTFVLIECKNVTLR